MPRSRVTGRSRPRAETDLHAPLRDYLEARGYTVHAEVDRCDLVARADDEVIIVELKRRLSLDLIVQGIDRQRITDSVYVAVPGPLDLTRRRWRGIRHLLRRLELGLLVVSFGSRRARVEVVLDPAPYTRRKLKRRRRAVLRELRGRSANYNEGGSTRRPIMTVYRENAIQIASVLAALGPLTPRQLRDLGAGAKTQAILYDNHYGWFERVERGVYTLTAAGRAALRAYPELAAQYHPAPVAAENPSGVSASCKARVPDPCSRV